MVSTGWDAADVDDADWEMLVRHVWGEPDEEGWLTAQVAGLHGYLFDLSETDVLVQADEISAGHPSSRACPRTATACWRSRPPTGFAVRLGAARQR